MKYYSLHRYGSIAALVFLSFGLHAKPNSSTGNFAKSLSFIENKGQITDQYGKHRNDIDYKLDGGNVTMFVGDGQIHYQWYQSNKKEKSKNEFPGDSKSPSGDLGVDVYRMDVVLLGANKNAEVIREGLQQGYENYYLPQCPDGVTSHKYSKITYQNIYPNIDWEIETAPLLSPKGEAGSHGCKYNFIVHPGGDYRNIKIQYNGATSIALKDGALVATTPMGSITENMPYTYDAETHKAIKSNFILNNNILSYNIALPLGSGEGDRASAFIIDPILKWATFAGGAGIDFIWKTATDAFSNGYVCGYSSSTTNIATTGTAQQVLSGRADAFVIKYDSSGARIWGTYYGGTADDAFYNLAVDAGGNVYATGSTHSAGLGTPGTHKSLITPSYNAAIDTIDAILVKFNSLGQRQWATYFGDTADDDGDAIAVDANGNIYMGGHTSNHYTLATPGAFQTSINADGLGFLAKFTNGGTRIWSTYYNGTVRDIALDTPGRVYITGWTAWPTGIATAGTFQPACPYCGLGSSNAGYIARFTASGSRVWGTYIADQNSSGHPAIVNSIVADVKGDIIAGGGVVGVGNLGTPGTYQPTLGGHAYIMKLKDDGTRIWGTYYGGTSNDFIREIVTDEAGNIYAMGETLSSTGIATPGAFQTTYNGFGNAFLACLNTTGQRRWGTYYGISATTGSVLMPDMNGGCAYSNGKIYLSNYASGPNGIATSNGYQSTYGGNVDGFLALFDADTMVFIRQRFTDTGFCIGDTLHLQYGTMQRFKYGNTFTVQLSNASGSFASPVNIGTLADTIGGIIKCLIPSVTPGTGYRVRIIANMPADTSGDDGYNIRISTPPTTPVATANTPVCAGQTLNLSSSNSSTGVVWNWIGPNSFTAATQNASIPNVQTNATGDYIVTANLNGCKRKDTVSVTVNQTPSKPNATSNSPICSGQTLNLFATSTTGGVSWHWVGLGGFNTSAQNPTIPNAQTSNAGSYVATTTLGSCSNSDTEVVVINQGPAVNVYPSPNDTICQGGSVTLVALPISAGTGPSFQWYKNSNPIGGATNTSYSTTPNNGDVYYCRMTPGTGTSCTGAINSNSITMTVLPVTTPGVSISGPAGAQNPYNLLTFHATGTGGGSSPTYQWLRSGQLVQGAIADTWSTQGLYLSQHDTICVILTSSDICAVPKSDTACMVVNILTGVDDVNKNTTIQLYPNPNDGRFTLYANSINDQDASVEISDAVGRVVYQQVTTAKKGNIDVRIDIHQLAAGVYILNLNDKTGRRTLRFVISR